MNEQAREVLAQLMQRALDGVDAAVEFSQQEIPDVVYQLLLWKATESAISMAWFLAMLCFLVFSWKKLIKYMRSSEIDDDETETAIYGVGAVLSFFWLLVSAFFFDLTWLKIWLAPKLYLLEYGASLIK
jgi:hypothetical protein